MLIVPEDEEGSLRGDGGVSDGSPTPASVTFDKTRRARRTAMGACLIVLVAAVTTAVVEQGRNAGGERTSVEEPEPVPAQAQAAPLSAGCPPFPAFPDKSCTGVPAGMPLAHYSGGPVTRDGSVISGVRITSRIEVRANRTTFRNCEIAPDEAIAIAVAEGFNDLTIENCTIRAGGVIPPAERFTLRRVKVEPSGYRPDGIVVGFSSIGHVGRDVLIEDSYISGLTPEVGDHADGVQAWGFDRVSNVVIRHNYIDAGNYGHAPAVPNAALFLADATYENVTVEFNYLAGGGLHVLQLYSNQPTAGHVVRHNRWARGGAPARLLRMTMTEWSDNAYADNLEVIAPPLSG